MLSSRQSSPGAKDIDVRERVKVLYYIMQTMERNVGGGEGLEGLYGSVTRSGMQKILDCMTSSCGLCSDSHLVDIGAGLGRPLLHALVSPGIASGFGIELDRIKCDKAAPFLERSIAALKARANDDKALPVPKVHCAAVEKVTSLGRATHAYSFWEGVPRDARIAFGNLFAATPAMQSVAVVQRAIKGRTPEEAMWDLGFGDLHLVSSFSVSMSGSGRSFTAYIFNKRNGELGAVDHSLEPATPAAAEGRRDSNVSSISLEDRAVDLPQTPIPAAEGAVGLHTPAKTPMSVLRDKIAGPHTPKSCGVTGAARRVPVAASRPPRPTPGKTAKSSPTIKPAQRPSVKSNISNVAKPATPARNGAQQPRRSARLAAAKTVQPVSPVQPPSPGSKGGVQKPQKGGLEAAGFRVRRASGTGRVAKFVMELEEKASKTVERPSVPSRGLGSITGQ